MRGVLRLSLYILMMAAGLFGCEQGVTDVGNPNIVAQPPAASPSMQNPGPTLGQLIGGYSLPSPVDAGVQSSPDGTSSPTASPTLPACTSDPQKNKTIVPTSDPTSIILVYFLDYGAATEAILAQYDAKTGAIDFKIKDPAVAIESCTGSAKNDSTGIAITLQCKARVNGESDCQVIFDKN